MFARTLVVFSTLPLLLMLKLDLASGQECNVDGFYCVSNTTFQQCVDGYPPSGLVNHCSAGFYCSMDCDLQCLTAIPCTSTTTQIPTTTELPSTTTELPSTTTEHPSTTTEHPSTTTELPSTTTELPSTTTEKPFHCTTAGRFADPNNCTNYYMCSPASSGDFYQYLYPCPGGSVFNPSTAKCTVDSTGTICPSASSSTSSTSTPTSTATSTTTSTTSTTTSTTPSSSSSSTSSSTSTTTTTATPTFKCETQGRFPYPGDCTKYYLCSTDPKGGFYMYTYTCPGGAFFDRVTAKCTVSSACPQS